MNLRLNYEGFEENLLLLSTPSGVDYGVQRLFGFKNGYGASVIKHSFSYGVESELWELAIINFTGYNYDYYLANEEIVQKMITDDYIFRDADNIFGYLTDKQVRKLLKEIKNYKN